MRPKTYKQVIVAVDIVVNVQNKRQLILYLEKSNFNVLHQLHLGW